GRRLRDGGAVRAATAAGADHRDRAGAGRPGQPKRLTMAVTWPARSRTTLTPKAPSAKPGSSVMLREGRALRPAWTRSSPASTAIRPDCAVVARLAPSSGSQLAVHSQSSLTQR